MADEPQLPTFRALSFQSPLKAAELYLYVPDTRRHLSHAPQPCELPPLSHV